MLANLLDDRLPHERNQRSVAKVFTRARAAELHQFAVQCFNPRQIEFFLGVKADVTTRLRSAKQAVSTDNIAAAQFPDNQMIAIGIEFVDIQPCSYDDANPL